jgi:outer membrane protein assembly factor BamD (BamD/ComL family)
MIARTAARNSALDSLDSELAVLGQAQEDLHAGLPAQALRRLAEYDRRFGKGTLNEERRAIGAIALCQAQPGPAAQAQAERFLRDEPQSPLAGRVRSACERSHETSRQLDGTEPDREP